MHTLPRSSTFPKEVSFPTSGLRGFMMEARSVVVADASCFGFPLRLGVLRILMIP